MNLLPPGHPLHPLVDRLAAVRRSRERLALGRGVARTFWLTVVLVLAALLFESTVHGGVMLRSILFWGVLTCTAGIVAVCSAPPALRMMSLLRRASTEEIASLVGIHVPELRDRLLNVLQLASTPDARVSASLVEAACADIAEATEGVDFPAAVDRRPFFTETRIAAGVLLGAAVLVLLLPEDLGGAAHRLALHDRPFAPPSRFTLSLTPGDREVVRGEDVRIAARIEGELPDEVVLFSRPDGQQSDDEHRFRQDSSGGFSVTLRALVASTSYRARAGSVETPSYRLTVSERPGVLRLEVTLIPPPYTGRPRLRLDDHVGDIAALKGTVADIAVRTTHPVQRAALVFRGGRTVPLRTTDGGAEGSFTVAEPASYHVALEDARGLENRDPVEYTVRVVADAFPTAAIPVPGKNLDITEAADLPLIVRAADDFGVTRLRLGYRLVRSRYEQPAASPTFVEIPLAERGRTDVITPFRWQLASLHLVPEDVVEYYVEATDNDRVSGPKSGESERFTLRLPSLDEVLADVHHDTERGRAELEETLRAAEEAARQSEELRRELRKDDRTTSWENRRKAEELARAYQEMQKSVEQSRNALQQALQHMEQNKLLSPETLEKYQELQQVLQDLASPEFAEAMKRLQQTMGQMNPEAMRQALQNFSFSEENFRKGLERTLNLLKRIQIEQKVDETLRRVEEMQNRLAELEKRTISPEAREQEARAAIERQQEDVRKKLGDLDHELSGLQARMEEFPGDMPLADMERARKEFGADSAAQRLQEAGERLERQDTAGAQEKQQEASQSLGRLEKSLAGMQQTLRKNQQRQVVNAMRRVVQDLLELSRRQEELKNSSRLLEPGSPQFRTNAQQQMENLRDLSNVTEQLSAVAQKSFGVTPEMGRALGEALKNMSESLQGLEARNGAVASERQSGAMSALNDAARLVQESLNAMMQGGGQGGGMAGFLQRLQGMSGMQQGINQGTQGLQQMSQQQAAAMARLAAEQAMVRKSLDQLSREASRQGDLSRMLGDLNTLAREMQEVQTDLARGSVTNETMRKQERILSRLLDSQRSARERDFEQQRRAETGRSTARSLPPQSDPSSLEGTSRLRRDLLRALEEGYAPDYQELIRKYYEALERQRTGTAP